MALTQGTRFGAYEIGEPIGAGGMGEVYRAHDAALARDVAIKVLPESFSADANRVARFEHEAKTLAALNHSNIAQIYGLERSGETTALVMELVEGPTLADRIERGPLPIDDALDVALQIAAALEAAHERGIVHRDLKPANIKLRPDGTVEVLDFGIAKALERRTTSGPMPAALTTPSMTEAGIVLGTAAYMSPEQARGKPVDKRADIWAFGCVLYEMLTGQAAFLGDDITTTLARVIERDPDMKPLPAGLSPQVHGTLELCLQKDPGKRLHDIGDVRLALEGGLAALAPAQASVAGLPLWRRALPAAAALVVGALIAGAYFTTSRVEPAPPPALRPELPVSRFAVTPPATAPLASLGGYDVTISPDGKRLAYFAEDPERGSVQLYVRDLDALEARPIPGTDVTNTSGGNMNPFFSPDGRAIGYFAPDRGVVRVSIDGAPPTKILDTPAPAFLGATWTSDDMLVYSPGRSLQRVSAAGGGTPERLTPDADDNTFIASPVLLPGGRAALIGQIVDGVESVAVADLTTGETKTLIEGGQNASYAPSGHIVFARGTTLMAAPFDAAELTLTGDPVAVVQNVRHPNSLSAADYAISQSGTLVYVPSGGDSGGLSAAVWVGRDGNVVGDPVADKLDNPRDPRLSPDGSRLLLTTGPIADGDLWSYDLSGRPPVPIATPNDNFLGVWSPDGKQVAFATFGASRSEIVTIPASGDVLTPQPLRAGGLPGEPMAWSKAGELFFITLMARGQASNLDIRVTPATATGDVRDVVATEYSEFDAALSPDGRWLAYVSNRTGTPEIWVQGYPDGSPVRVSSSGGWEPRWSADGKELYYLQGNTVWVAAVEAGDEFSFAAPVALFNRPHYLNISSDVNSYDVASDGRFLMIEAAGAEAASGGSASIVVVQNWTEELERRVPSLR
jgi:Tol biopolymer transport system component